MTAAKRYCIEHGLALKGMMGILYDGFVNGLITPGEVDRAIQYNVEQGKKVPNVPFARIEESFRSGSGEFV